MKTLLMALACVIAWIVHRAMTGPESQIDEAAARRQAIAHYNVLFRNKFYEAGGKHYRFPELHESFFHKATLKGNIWELEGDPPAGVHVYARVSADGKSVQLTRVGFAAF